VITGRILIRQALFVPVNEMSRKDASPGSFFPAVFLQAGHKPLPLNGSTVVLSATPAETVLIPLQPSLLRHLIQAVNLRQGGNFTAD
jgi:hypothetical protein